MTIEKLRKRKDENIILGVEKKVRVFFFFLAVSSSRLSPFFLSDKKNIIPTFLLVCFYQERKKKGILSKAVGLYLSNTTTIIL
jgi:hypothetical protein